MINSVRLNIAGGPQQLTVDEFSVVWSSQDGALTAWNAATRGDSKTPCGVVVAGGPGLQIKLSPESVVEFYWQEGPVRFQPGSLLIFAGKRKGFNLWVTANLDEDGELQLAYAVVQERRPQPYNPESSVELALRDDPGGRLRMLPRVPPLYPPSTDAAFDPLTFNLYGPADGGALDDAVLNAKQALDIAAKAANNANSHMFVDRWHNNPPPDMLVNDEERATLDDALDAVRAAAKVGILTPEAERALAILAAAAQRIVEWATPFAKEGAEQGLKDGVKLGLIGLLGTSGLLAGGALTWVVALGRQLLGM